MWFDGANGGDGYYGGANEKRRINGATYYDWPTTLDMVKKKEPGIIFFSDAGPGVRWCGNERGVAGETNWNNITPDTLYAGKAGIEQLLNTGSENGTHWIPSEVDVSIRPGWFYHEKEDTLVKTPEKLFEIYLSSVGRGSTLLLNIPPDKRGLIHERDVQSLKGFRQLLDTEFKHNLARPGVVVTASSFRGNSGKFSATNLIDGNTQTYWATDDNVKKGWLEINFKVPKPVKYVLLQEFIKLGQRVKSFSIEAWDGKRWRTVSEGTTIGYKRILKLKEVNTSKIRINISDSKACPVLSNVEVY
jgi:alpha-L-fucosidase